jgi:hypothetical protein
MEYTCRVCGCEAELHKCTRKECGFKKMQEQAKQNIEKEIKIYDRFVSTDEVVAESKNPKYWSGLHNKVIRYYKYAQHGLATVNEFRYIGLACFGIYYTLRLKNFMWIPLMFVISLPILIAIGWWYVHHAAKVLEYISIRFSTVWGLYNYKLLEEQLNSLKQIKNLLKKEKRNEHQRICKKSNSRRRIKEVNINRTGKRSLKNR